MSGTHFYNVGIDLLVKAAASGAPGNIKSVLCFEHKLEAALTHPTV